MKRCLAFVCALTFAPSLVHAQALTSLASLRVGYATRKNTIKPTGELKAQIDAIDAQIAEATRLGHTGEIRRLIAKGNTLLSNRPWTDAIDFGNSLVLRTDRVVADSTKPYRVRLEQIYQPSIALSQPLTAKVSLRKRQLPQAPPSPGQQPAPPETVKELGTFDGVTRDLRESPFPFELDVHDVVDGTYLLNAEVMNGSDSLGNATLTIALRNGLDDLAARLDAASKQAPENLRAEILFPLDRMRNVNRGRIELRTFDPEKDLASAESVAAAVKAKQDPFAKRTGDFKRHYTLDAANEVLPYHMYVPTAYNGSRAFPLIVALHGLGGTEDSFFDGYESSCRRWPSSTATSSPLRSAIASMDRTAGGSAIRRMTRRRAGRRSSASRT